MLKTILIALFLFCSTSVYAGVTIPAVPLPSWLPTTPPCFGVTYSFFIKAAYQDIVNKRELTPIEAVNALLSSCVMFGNTPVKMIIQDNPCTLAVAHEAYIAHNKPRAIEEKWFRQATGSEYVKDVYADQDHFNEAYAKAYKSCVIKPSNSKKRHLFANVIKNLQRLKNGN